MKHPSRLEIRVSSRPEYVHTVRLAIAEFARLLDMPPKKIEEIEIATSEALANVIRHAYAGCESPPVVQVKCSQLDNGMAIEVIDRGCGFDAPAAGVVPEVDFSREGGLGIILMKRLMDSVEFVSERNHGTRIRMTKHTPPAHGGKRSGRRATRRDLQPAAPATVGLQPAAVGK